MGFSVSGSAALVFVAVLFGISVLVPTMIEDTHRANEAADRMSEVNTKAEATAIEIRNLTCVNNDLVVGVYNNGSTTLDVDSTDLFLDGVYQPETTYTTDVEGNTNKPLWFAGETLNFTVDTPPENVTQVRVVTEYGIAAERNYSGTC